MHEPHRRAVALVDVGDPQPVDLGVARLVVEVGQVGEPFVGGAEDVGCAKATIMAADAIRGAVNETFVRPDPLSSSTR